MTNNNNNNNNNNTNYFSIIAKKKVNMLLKRSYLIYPQRTIETQVGTPSHFKRQTAVVTLVRDEVKSD